MRLSTARAAAPTKTCPGAEAATKQTATAKTVYLHVSPLIAQKGKELKGSEPLLIKDIGEKFTKATVIADGTFNGKEAKLEKEDGQYKITLPAGMSWDKWDTVIKLQ